MLFLFNESVLRVEAPEARVSRGWKTLGCGDPGLLRARDAVEYVARVMKALREDGREPDEELRLDLAALIIAKTGANAALFLTGIDNAVEPRITLLPDHVLEALAERQGQREDASIETIRALWHRAA